jgi:hypothetical protein
MMRHEMIAPLKRLALAALLTLSLAPAAAAQSFLANQGLGLGVEPRSARSSALGGVSLGLPGSEISWANPAGAVGLPAGGLLASYDFDRLSAATAAGSQKATAARFPLILAAFPFGPRWAVTAGLGGFLDQNWAVQRQDSIVRQDTTLQVVDRISSEGGVGRLRVGAGYRVLPTLSVGIGMDLYTGGVTRTEGRIFLPDTGPACCQTRWDYTGLGGLASVDWNPSEALSVSLAGAAGGKLVAKPRAGGTESRYSLPASLDAGATARVAPSLLIAVGAGWRGWSSVNAALSQTGGARDAWTAQGGLEWDAFRVGARTLPLRLGGRTGALPFRAAATGSAWATERAVTGGTGISLGSGAVSADVGVERGWRSAGAASSESFWRLSLSLSALGQ